MAREGAEIYELTVTSFCCDHFKFRLYYKKTVFHSVNADSNGVKRVWSSDSSPNW